LCEGIFVLQYNDCSRKVFGDTTLLLAHLTPGISWWKHQGKRWPEIIILFSRLVLCKTFRLEEDGKVLSPEELLYRCVHLVQQTHDRAGMGMDVKLRSLICLGLNEQVLHLWLECLCGAEKALDKWYLPRSLLTSPGWVLIKCELRTLAQFSFQLSADWELPDAREDIEVREGVQDMLVKHHLFSWEI